MQISQPTAQKSATTPTSVAYAAAVGASNAYAAGDHAHDAQLTQQVATLGSDVATGAQNNVINVISINLPAAGRYFIVGYCSVLDTTNAGVFQLRIWDGATVIASAKASNPAANVNGEVECSGTYTAAGAATVTMTLADTASANGAAKANGSGYGHDTQMSAVRLSD